MHALCITVYYFVSGLVWYDEMISPYFIYLSQNCHESNVNSNVYLLNVEMWHWVISHCSQTNIWTVVEYQLLLYHIFHAIESLKPSMIQRKQEALLECECEWMINKKNNFLQVNYFMKQNKQTKLQNMNNEHFDWLFLHFLVFMKSFALFPAFLRFELIFFSA